MRYELLFFLLSLQGIVPGLVSCLVVGRSDGVRVSPRHRRHRARTHDEGARGACVEEARGAEGRRNAIIISATGHCAWTRARSRLRYTRLAPYSGSLETCRRLV